MRLSGATSKTKGGSFSGSISESRCTCTSRLVQAEFTSKAGSSSPRAAATLQASAGEAKSGAELPAISIPIWLRSIPARSIASSEARRPSSEVG